MRNNSWLVTLVTLGPLGHVRGGGTLATCATMPLVYLLNLYVPNVMLQASFVLFSFIAAIALIHKALPYFDGKHDPSEIVLDEVVGFLVTMYGISCTIPTLVVGFMLFRFFDIFKPCGIKKVEKFPGAVGIVADDIVAAVYARIAWWVIGLVASLIYQGPNLLY